MEHFTYFGGADEQSSTPRARSLLFAKKDDVLRWIMQWFTWGVGGFLVHDVQC